MSSEGRKINVAVRVSYPEDGQYDWYSALAEYIEVGAVEIAFHKSQLFLENVAISDVLTPFSKLPLTVASVHMAHAKITKPETFVAVLEKTIRIAEALGCGFIIVHPSYGSLRGSLEEFNAFFAQRIDPLLEATNTTLLRRLRSASVQRVPSRKLLRVFRVRVSEPVW